MKKLIGSIVIGAALVVLSCLPLQSQGILALAGNGPNGGSDPLSDIKDGLLAWYDMTNGTGTKDLSDQTGNEGDLLEVNTPTYAANYALVDDADTPNRIQTPAGLMHSSASFLPNTNSDGTWVVAFRPVDTNSGDFVANRARYTIGTNGEVKMQNGSSGSGTTPANVDGTDYVIAATLDGSANEIKGYLDGVENASATGVGFFAETDPVRFPIDSLSSSDAQFRIYWIGYWDRILTADEISALTYDLEYSDLP